MTLQVSATSHWGQVTRSELIRVPEYPVQALFGPWVETIFPLWEPDLLLFRCHFLFRQKNYAESTIWPVIVRSCHCFSAVGKTLLFGFFIEINFLLSFLCEKEIIWIIKPNPQKGTCVLFYFAVVIATDISLILKINELKKYYPWVSFTVTLLKDILTT